MVTEFVKSKVYAIPENYQAIAGCLTLPMFTMISFWIEILASKRWVPRSVVFMFVVLNLLALLVFPLILSFALEINYVVGSFLFMYTVTMVLKMISFHHVMHDVRGLVTRVIKAKKEGKTLEPSQVEGTILGVNTLVYEHALTYPKCLTYSHFLRFKLAPTCCF